MRWSLLLVVCVMLVAGEARASTDDCRVDTICAEAAGWEKQVRSVIRFDVDKPDGAYFGTGTFIHDPAWPGRPLILSAAHVFAKDRYGQMDQSDVDDFAERTSVRFNWRASQCGHSPAGGSWQDVTAVDLQATIVAYDNHTDTVLVELGVPLNPAWNVYFSGWKALDGGEPPSQGAILHHGDADPLRFALTPPDETFLYYDDESHLLVYEYITDIIEAGSSGGAYFDTDDQLIVAVVSNWHEPQYDFDCTYAPENLYGRWDVAYNAEFHYYMGGGATWTSGFDPYGPDSGESDAVTLPAVLHDGESYEYGYSQGVSVPPGFHAEPGCQMHLYPAP